MDDDTDNYGGDLDMRAEVGVWDRVALPGNLICGAELTGNISDMQRKIRKLVQDPEQRFGCYVDAIARSLGSRSESEISATEINNMITLSSKIPKIQYKNPTAYILGYMVSKGGKEIDKKIYSNVVKTYLPHVDPKIGLTEPDIIRYARLCINIQKNS